MDLLTDDFQHQMRQNTETQTGARRPPRFELPKALPGASGDPECRIRHDRIDDSGVVPVRHAGRLHHIGIGRTHARTNVILLVHDLDIRIVNATTGELLRELTLNPNVDYQPRNTPMIREITQCPRQDSNLWPTA